MDEAEHQHDENDGARVLTEIAERLSGLAETAELMGDQEAADRFRLQANEVRLRAMTKLD